MEKTAPAREEERALLDRIAQGDVEAYGDLVLKYQDSLVTFLLNKVKDRALAEDLAQEAFLKAYQSLRTYEGRNHAGFGTWLFTIARNAAFDAVRRGKWKMEEVDENMPAFRSEAPQEGHIRDARFRGVLENALAQLGEKFRACFDLTLVQGFTYEEAAEVLKTNPRNVRYMVNRTREHLKKRLSAFAGGL
jgi:RNA polymerase sigma-70 factor (ECF subfamily)